MLLTAGWADQASKLYNAGRVAIGRKDYDTAYADFRRASDLRPDVVDYSIAARRYEFVAANAHVQKGEQLKAQKQYPEAAAEMQKAMALDPGNFMAGQELEAINNLMHPPAAEPGEAVGAAAANSLESRLARAAGPTELGPVAGTILKDFSINGDPKAAYSAAGKLAGLNVIFDASTSGGYSNSGHITLDLHNVSLLEVLRILGVESNSFYTVITPNTILVANDNPQKHQAVDPTVLKVFYIKNIQQASDLQELAQAIRGLMQPQPHLMPVASINAIVMRDSPDKVAVVQKLLDDLDKAPPEVVVDIRILSVNRDVARDLGLLPPTSVSIGLVTPTVTTPATTTDTTTTTTPAAATGIPTLNELTHLNSSNFTVTIPNSTLNALLSDSSTKTVQEPQLRAVQNVKATLQIGQKIPVATGSFQPGIGGVGINPLVNTQFTYQPVGVNIDLTPEIHGNDDVLLKTRVEISDVDSYSNIGGIEQPVIGQKVVDHTVDLKNNESSVEGGILEDELIHNVSGLPGLQSIPLFKYLFSSSHDETDHTELLIVMTPHIVRTLNLTALNEASLDTGTQDDLQLHELPPATMAAPGGTGAGESVGATAAPENGRATAVAPPAVGTATSARTPVESAPANAPNAALTPAAPKPAAATPAGAAGGGPAELQLQPAAVTAAVGNPFGVKIAVANMKSAYALTFQINFDPKLVSLQSMNLGSFLGQDGQAPAMVHRDDNASGTAQVTLSRPPNVTGVSGAGDLVTLTFVAKSPGVTAISLSRLSGRDPSGALVPLQSVPASVTIH